LQEPSSELIIAAGGSIPLLISVGCLFLVYVAGGYTASSLGFWTPAYEFLSLTNDIYFAWLGFVVGITICVGTGSIAGLAFLSEGKGEVHTEILMLSSFIGFGFGAGVVRMTYMTVLATVL